MSIPILVVDVGALTCPDARTLEALARMQLAAQRAGASICLRHAGTALRDLLAWSGFAELLPLLAESGVDEDRLVEQREELVVDEVVDPRDPTA